jgi:putative DNA methylase
MTAAARVDTPAGLAPFSLKDASSFIERQFPVGRLSAEAYKERKAGSGQTLTALGSYWKGRKPLILVRAIVLGSLLPATDDPAADLDIFLKLMAMDDGAFGRRFDGSATDFARLFPDHANFVATNLTRVWRRDLPPDELRKRAAEIRCLNAAPHPYEEALLVKLLDFSESPKLKEPDASAGEFATVFAHAADELTEEVETRWRWREDIHGHERQVRIAEAFATLPYSFDQRLKHVRRPEECDETELLAPIWGNVNRHIGTAARSLAELVEQLGVARFGHRPKVADTFCGGGSIPFEAARIGCDVYASDLNPIACMLTWGAFNIIGASAEKRAEIEEAQRQVAASVDAEITRLGIEHDAEGNRAKTFLYCLETRCPKTGWMVPMVPSWVISKTRNVVAKLAPDQSAKRYTIEIHSGVSATEMAEAENGTVRGGRLVHPMNPERSGVEIKTIRGDFRDAEGNNRNGLRLWEKSDFIPHPDDIFQERLYCIQWITKESVGKGRQETFFAAVNDDDLTRERKVEAIVAENLARWQEDGLIPDMEIEPGDKTDEPIRTRGWTHWHHLFGSRTLLWAAAFESKGSAVTRLNLFRGLDYGARLCSWDAGHKGSSPQVKHVFVNQAFNTMNTYCSKSAFDLAEVSIIEANHHPVRMPLYLYPIDARNAPGVPFIYITAPPTQMP